MMAWVNLAALPSDARRFFYVMGESQNGNDLDVQFETDNQLKFYTAAGGHVSFTPPPDKLLDQWHLILVTLDTPTKTRVIYWDGKSVASDKGSGAPNKSGAFTIGESQIFKGRFFKGGIQEVALWNRALKADEVDAIYAASSPATANSAAAPASAEEDNAFSKRNKPAAGAITYNAKVEAEDSSGPIKLKDEEKTALMFLTAIQNIENDCQSRAKRACTMSEMLAGPVGIDGKHLSHLKFDPATDPNYTYVLAASGTAWEVHANAKKPGLIGFYFLSKSFPGVDATYNPSGTASAIDKQITGRSTFGDSFAIR
jgi:hypothetical protein